MASAFGHVAVAYALGKSFNLPCPVSRLWTLTVVCCLLPDVDVISFALGIPYGHPWGHRGMTHSIACAVLLGFVAARMAHPAISLGSQLYWITALYFSLVTMSHGVLDALTDGGLGIAFFAPFDSTRYFFPWRPISVSPIGIIRFFSDGGMRVLLSELVWIGIPVGLWLFLLKFRRRTEPTEVRG